MVSKRLLKYFRDEVNGKNASQNQREYPTLSLNQESAKFAVHMARSMGLITRNMVWDWKGRAIAILLEDIKRTYANEYLNLTETERILYLKYYLEADGAVLLSVANVLRSRGQLSRSELLSTNLIDEIFVEIWESYRGLTSDLREKMSLRENIRKLRSKSYTPKTRIHKALAHVEPLVAFGFAERRVENKEIMFLLGTGSGTYSIENLVGMMSSIEEMETRFSKFEHFRIIANAYSFSPKTYDPSLHSEALLPEIFRNYRKARMEPTGMASIGTISDATSATMLAKRNLLLERPDIERQLVRLKSTFPRDVRFHIDKHGRKEFVVISENLYKSQVNEETRGSRLRS